MSDTLGSEVAPGVRMPRLGLGTWDIGVRAGSRGAEVAALRLGLDLGMRLIDTAEMYGDGGAEEVVGEAIAGRRDAVFLVTKVLPQHASRTGTIAACERSLRRLRTDRIDLYLLHWEGEHPLQETLAAFVELRAQGKIRAYGVSNFDVDLCAALRRMPGGEGVIADQVYYSPTRRGIEWDLLPWCRDHAVAVMAYSPLDQGRLALGGALARVARRHGATPAQVALAWTIRLPGVAAIPKAARPEHVRDNAGALRLRLTPEDLAEIDREFPPPAGKLPLAVV